MKNKNFAFTLFIFVSSYFGMSAQFEFDAIPIAPDAGPGKIWELQEAPSDDFNYTFNPSTTRVNFGPSSGNKWYNSYHDLPSGNPNIFEGPGPTIWKPQNVFVDGDQLNVFNTRIPGEEKNQFATSYNYGTRGGCMTSLTKVLYPVFVEARVRIANSTAASNVWLLSPDDTQEIDIIEAYGGRGTGGTVGGKNVPANRNAFFAERIHLSHHVFIRTPFKDYQPRDFNSFWRRSGITEWGGKTVDIGVNWISPTRIEYYIDGKLRRVLDNDASGSEVQNGTWQYTYPAGLVNARGETVSTNLGSDGQLLFVETGFETGFQSMAKQNCGQTTTYDESCLDAAKASSSISVIDPFNYLSNGRRFTKELDIIINTEDQSFQADAIPSRSPADQEIAATQIDDQTMLVDWIRVYKPVNIDGTTDPTDRTRSVTFANRTSFIPSGATNPEFEQGQEIPLEITYETGISGGVEEDLAYIATQVRELDENGNIVSTSAFQVAVGGENLNTGENIAYNYTIPANFEDGNTIPTTADLEAGHQLLLLMFMSVDNNSGFANANEPITLIEAGATDSIDRTRSITFANINSFIPSGATNPEFEQEKEVALEITYETGVSGGVEEDLTYIATQIRELDENGNIVGTSAFQIAVEGDSPNVGANVIYNYTVPTNFATGPDNITPLTTEIPTTSNLDAGHQLLLLMFMSVDDNSGFINANSPITLEKSTLSVNDVLIEGVSNSVYPNPAANVINIAGEFEGWKIFNLSGIIVKEGSQEQINIADLISGLYYISLDNSLNKVLNFIKN